MASPLRPLALSLALCACGPRPGEPCSSCPDVSGRYQVLRTVLSSEGCVTRPVGGEAVVLLSQNGSAVEVEYEGALLKGDLLDDATLAAEGSGRHSAAGEAYDLTARLAASFSADAQGRMRLAGTVVETRIAEGSPKPCEVTSTLDGTR